MDWDPYHTRDFGAVPALGWGRSPDSYAIYRSPMCRALRRTEENRERDDNQEKRDGE